LIVDVEIAVARQVGVVGVGLVEQLVVATDDEHVERRYDRVEEQRRVADGECCA